MANKDNTHLHRVKIKGFKSIKNLDLNMLPVNILIGANGAGKSNFISLFTFLRQLSEGRLQNYVERNGYANTFFHFGSKTTQEISFHLEVGENGYHVNLEHGVSDDSLVFASEYCTFSATGPNRAYSIKGSKGESGLLPGGEADSKLVKKYTREYLQNCRVYHFHDTSPTATFKQAQRLHSSVYLAPDAGNLAPFLFVLKERDAKSYNEIVSTIQTVTPFFHDFDLTPTGEKGNESILLRWKHRDHDESFSANQLSDGTARFICMATLFLQPDWLRPKTIVLDEPELGLHPAALEVLSDLIKLTSKTNQVICSTQSATFANYFQAEEFIIVDQEKGVSNFNRPDKSELKHWLEDYGMGDIWTKNLIGGRPEW